MSAESVARIEPARLEEPTTDIADVIAELAASSATLGKALHSRTAANPEAVALLQEALFRGQLERGEVARITGLPERSARRVLNDVLRAGLLASETPKAAVSLRFPADALEDLFPSLYPRT